MPPPALAPVSHILDQQPDDPSPDDLQHHDYPDRSTYQQLPDSPQTPAAETPSQPEEDATLISLEPDAASDRHEDFDIASLKGFYKRSGEWGPNGSRSLLHREIGVVRRNSVPPQTPGTERASSQNPDQDDLANVGGLDQDMMPPAVRRRPANSDPERSRSPPSTIPVTSPRQRDAVRRPQDVQSPPPPPPPQDPQIGGEAAEGEAEEEEEVEGSQAEEEGQSGTDVDEDEEDMEEDESWIASFCNVVGHEYFAEVGEDFIEDDFNLTGLGAMVSMYKEALEMILDVEPEDDSDSLASASESLSEQPAGAQANVYRRRSGHARTNSDYSVIESSAERLYGLIHQRFITSRQGIQVMYEKYLSNHFGFCPRVNCNSARVLPCGYSDTPGQETVKLFCPSCCDIYVPPNSRFQSVDGAYFGTTFPTLFLMTFPELDISGNGRKEIQATTSLNSAGGRKGATNANQPVINGVPGQNLAPGLGKNKKYEMRIYGFRVNERARSGPRMGWLRDKPEDLSELNELDKFASGDNGVGYDSDEEDGSDGQGSEGEEDLAYPVGKTATAASTEAARRPARRGGGGSPMDLIDGR